jgi:HAD superfamily hydrolase (TIGR01450 family)
MAAQRTIPSSSNVPPVVLERLHNSRGFVFDMDGTLVISDKHNHGLTPLPGALELTRWLTGRGIPYVVFTNGTARTPQQYARTLREAGFVLPDEIMMTPASCAADLFVSRGYRRVMAFGGDGVAQPLRDAGIEIVPTTGKQQADAVFAGWHREFTMDAVESACHAVWNGAEMFSASQTRFFATAEGKTLAPSRAITAMIKDMTGCRVTTTGKPSLDALRGAAHRLDARLRYLTVVGDDPILEMSMANRGRSLAVAVTTGLCTEDSFASLPKQQQPHLMLSGVDKLLRLFEDPAKRRG